MRNPILDIAKTKAWITMIVFQTMHPPLTQTRSRFHKKPLSLHPKKTPHMCCIAT